MCGSTQRGQCGDGVAPFGRQGRRAWQRAVDEQLVPQVVAEQAVEEPAGSRPGGLDSLRIEKVVIVDLLDQGPQLAARVEPLEDRLAETELAAVGQLRLPVAG